MKDLQPLKKPRSATGDLALPTKTTLCLGDSTFSKQISGLLRRRSIPCDIGLLSESLLDEEHLTVTDFQSVSKLADETSFDELLTNIRSQANSNASPLIFCPLDTSVDDEHQRWSVKMAALRAYGATLFFDVRVWIEAMVIALKHGTPESASIAIVAPKDSVLFYEARGHIHWTKRRRPRLAMKNSELEHHPSDVVFYDPSISPSQDFDGLALPISPAYDPGNPSHLLGLKDCIQAIEILAEAQLRLTSQLGRSKGHETEWDEPRLKKQLNQCGTEIGDHETKVMLSCFTIPVTRQALASTPSAASRLAKKAGYPVDLKPWGPEQPSEKDGCLVELNIDSAADVRRAYTSVCNWGETETAIVRAAPPKGRECSIELLHHEDLGWFIECKIEGVNPSLSLVAPASRVDAKRIAQKMVSTRQTDHEPNVNAMVELLVSLSRMPEKIPTLKSISCPRVLIGSDSHQVMVIDASSTLETNS